MGNDSSGMEEWPKPKKTCKEKRLPGWECLPAVILDDVFKHLTFKDVVNASSTCRNWRQSLYHPRSWQHVTFVIEPETIPQVQYLRNTVGHIISSATIKFNSMIKCCIIEFLLLLETFTHNNNLQSLILEPSYCHIIIPDSMIQMLGVKPLFATILNLCSNRPMTKFSLGCNEDLLQCVPNILQLLSESKPEEITTLGLASVKDDPVNYIIHHCEPHLFLPFQRLQILSIDYDYLNDDLLSYLHNVTDLQRLVVHLHGIWEGHPGTSEEAWKSLKTHQPNCLLRLTLIHAFEEVALLHDVILKENMPLSHLKVLFCEDMNQLALVKLIKYRDTFVSLMWVDSLRNGTGDTYSLLRPNVSFYDQAEAEPRHLILLAWLCTKLEEIVVLGYKYFEVDWVGIAKLRGDTLKKLVFATSDLLRSSYDHTQDIPSILGKTWAPLKLNDLHPVLLNPEDGDSDEYLLPILLADLH